MSRVALRKTDDDLSSKVDSSDWWGDFDINVLPKAPRLSVYENPRIAGRHKLNRVQERKTPISAMAFLALVFFFTLAALQISRIAEFSEKGKAIVSIKNDIKDLEKDINTKSLRLAMQNIDLVQDIATRELGMSIPTEEQTIVVSRSSVALIANEKTTDEEVDEELEAYGAP